MILKIFLRLSLTSTPFMTVMINFPEFQYLFDCSAYFSVPEKKCLHLRCRHRDVGPDHFDFPVYFLVGQISTQLSIDQR